MTISGNIRSDLGFRAALTARIRARIIDSVQASVGGGPEELANYHEPAGDPGLLGPASPAWRVHGDLACMLYGGFAALMLQTLNPRAMAGVAQHSSYRDDPTGRLRRTARFVAGTTYGPMPFVEQLFSEVRHVHAFVHGTTPEGERYSAEDPDLLTWVHVTEVRHFLASYLRYGGDPFTSEEVDRYFSDIAVIAERLGAIGVPRSFDEVERYLQAMRPELRATREARDAVHFLSTTPVGGDSSLVTSLVTRLAHRIIVGAAIDLLPPWARQQLGRDSFAVVLRIPRRFAAQLLARVLRWGLGPSRAVLASRARIARASSVDASHFPSGMDQR